MNGGAGAREVVAGCLRRGVREFCVCAGARNSALLVALGSIRSSEIAIWRFYEERSAAFFAVGRMQVTQRPVAVLMTSGTAVGEVLPAVMEAHYQGLPMVVLSADRPVRFRGSGAPQAVEQVGIFGGYVEACIDWAEGCDAFEAWGGRSPLHVNVCLEEPTAEGLKALESRPIDETPGNFEARRVAVDPEPLKRFLAGTGDLIVLAGALAESSVSGVKTYLRALGAPVFAEAISGLREDSLLDAILLRGPETGFGSHPWKRVLRVGGVPSGRFWRDLETRSEIEVCSLTATGFSGLARKSTVVAADPGKVLAELDIKNEARIDEAVLRRDRRAAARVDELSKEFPRSEAGLVRWLSGEIPRESSVFLGNSLPVREWNLCAERKDRSRRYFANRGANGIDGTLSTFLGTGFGANEAWGIFGDLAALYDLGAPWILEQTGSRLRRFVIVNNGGGKIFSRLPALRNISGNVMEMIENPHDIGFENWAAMWGMDYRRVDEPGDLNLDDANTVVEVRPDAKQSAGFWAALDAKGGRE